MKEFECSDLFLAAAVACFTDLSPKFKIKGSKVFFVFIGDTNDIYRAIGKFNADEPIPASSYASMIKDLRGRMYQLKGSA